MTPDPSTVVVGRSRIKTSKLYIIPMDLSDANDFVAKHHRHHKPVIGHKFSIGVMDEAHALQGVAIIGRPTARMSDDGWTLEVLRVATNGCRNACSALYGAARRAAWALGYKRLITYTLKSESGTSLVAAGWKQIGEAGGGSWSRKSRPRTDNHPLELKLRWEAT